MTISRQLFARRPAGSHVEASRTSIQAEGQARNVARLQTSLAEADQGARAAIEAELAAAQATLTTLQGDLQSLQQRSSQLLAEADASDSESKLIADSPWSSCI